MPAFSYKTFARVFFLTNNKIILNHKIIKVYRLKKLQRYYDAAAGGSGFLFYMKLWEPRQTEAQTNAIPRTSHLMQSSRHNARAPSERYDLILQD